MKFVSPEGKTAVIFEEMGFRYIGPIDGHDYDALCDIISNARRIPGPVLLHVRTVKGKGFEPAESDARTFHGVGPNVYSPDEGRLEKKSGRPTFAQAFADALIAVAGRDERGHRHHRRDARRNRARRSSPKRFPTRYFDVGIAEAHAVCFAAGASTSNVKPVCAIYSTFLQRAYDQIVHDVAVQNLPVVFALDRAGFVGDDGPTHMGLYDIAYLRTLPNMTLMAPRNEAEIAPMLDVRAGARRAGRDALSARQLQRQAGTNRSAPVVAGRAEVLRRGRGVAILALGSHRRRRARRLRAARRRRQADRREHALREAARRER